MKTITTIIAFLLITSLNAQWTPDTDANTLVANSPSGDMKAEGTSDGKTYIVFWKSVPAPVNYELRLQILDVDGNQTLGPDGILVSDEIPMSTYTVIGNTAVDADNNLYIGATGTGGGDPAFVFKLDSGGNHLWDSNGVNVGNGNVVTIFPLSSGETLVSWFPSGAALMQKLDGNGDPVWPTAQPVENAGNATVPANMYELSNGDYIMVFHSILSGIYSNLYAQRFDGDGETQWANPVQLANNATTFNGYYSGAQDGDVIYYGYKASSGVRFDSFLQRLNADGSLPWGINGMDFDTNQTNYEMDTQIAFQSGSSYVWAICTYTDGTQSIKGEYVQKFDKNSGARQFTDIAKEIFPLGSENIHSAGLHLKNDQPLFLIKSGMDNGVSPVTLHATYLDANGDFFWPEEMRPVATFAANKSRIHYTAPVNNQSVAVFIEDKGAGAKIYAQNFVDGILAIESNVLTNELFYNNPVDAILNIKSAAVIKVVTLHNLLGQIVFESKFEGKPELNISLPNLKTGSYFMTVITENGIHNGLQIIKK